MKRYRVILSRRALRQLSAIEQWIEDEASPSIARRYREAIIAHCRTLERLPNRGSPRDDLRAGMRTILFRRRVTVGYVVEGAEVVIVAIVGRGRDPNAALND